MLPGFSSLFCLAVKPIDLALNSSFDTYWVCDLEWVTCLETCFPHLYNGANGTYFTEVL